MYKKNYLRFVIILLLPFIKDTFILISIGMIIYLYFINEKKTSFFSLSIFLVFGYIFEKNIVSRSILRKVLQCKDVTEMEDVLGIRFSEKPFGQKSILRINLELDEMRAQDKAIYKLNADKRNKLKKLLLSIVSKIESMNDSE